MSFLPPKVRGNPLDPPAMILGGRGRQLSMNQENKEHSTDNLSSAESEEKIIQIKEADYQKLVEELNSFKDKYLRLYAEFDNARKRFERDKDEFAKFAHGEVIIDLLDIIDDLERSFDAVKKQTAEANALHKGIEMVIGRMNDLLKKYDVKRIDCIGKPFDPHCHEPLMQVETDDHSDGTVVEEFQKGYTLGGRVVRTAKVKVAKNNKQ